MPTNRRKWLQQMGMVGVGLDPLRPLGALAGARVGYAVAHKDTIGRLAAQQTWANGGVSVVSRAGALAALMDQDFARQCRAQNQAARDYTVA